MFIWKVPLTGDFKGSHAISEAEMVFAKSVAKGEVGAQVVECALYFLNVRENYFNSFVVFLKHLVDASVAPLVDPG